VTSDFAMALTQDMLWTAIMISAPVLGLSMLVGLLISVFQVVTQLQEMSLTFIPKILTVAFVLITFGSWMLNTLLHFATTLIRNIPLYFN
jgi:flagellar biosynthetic protein FliQ